MKKEFKLNRLFVSLMVIGASMSFVACDSDDNKIVVEPNTKDAWGEFKGTMLVSPLAPAQALADEKPEGTAVEATVKNDTVYFNSFPVEDLIKSLIPAEGADEIIKAIGDVKYKVGYKAVFNTAKDSVYMAYDPKPLELKVPMGEEKVLNVKVTVSAMNKGSYELSSANYKFDIQADKVTVDGTEMPTFPASSFKFDMKKNK